MALIKKIPIPAPLNHIVKKIDTALRTWKLRNTENAPFSVLQGQFIATDLTETTGSNWASHVALNRDRVIRQFLSGTLDRITVNVTFFGRHVLEDPTLYFETLKEWSRRDNFLGRPPVLEFWVGDGHVAMPCTLAPITFNYFDVRELGRVRGATIPLTLERYDEYSVDEISLFDTFYYRSRGVGDYYEMITWNQYKEPLLGVVIRSRNPTKLSLQRGDRVALPSAQSIRTEPIQPASFVMRGLESAGDTPQKQLMARVLKRISKPAVINVTL